MADNADHLAIYIYTSLQIAPILQIVNQELNSLV